MTQELLQKPAEHFTVRGPDFALYEQNAVFNCQRVFLIVSEVFSSQYSFFTNAILFSIECCIVCTCAAKHNSRFCVKMMSFIRHGESNAPYSVLFTGVCVFHSHMCVRALSQLDQVMFFALCAIAEVFNPAPIGTHCPAELSSNSDQTHLYQLIELFGIA